MTRRIFFLRLSEFIRGKAQCGQHSARWRLNTGFSLRIFLQFLISGLILLLVLVSVVCLTNTFDTKQITDQSFFKQLSCGIYPFLDVRVVLRSKLWLLTLN